MAYTLGSEPGGVAPPAAELKIVVAGGFGVGKTTMVATLSEIKPLTTEEVLTDAGRDIDDLTGVGMKTTTTVAMDFGRITFAEPIPMILFLFGTPGQERFWSTWDDLSRGAVGAVVLADTRRLEDSFAAVNYFEQLKRPFVVAVNEFDNADRYPPDEVREALELDPKVPVLTCDVRERASANAVLVRLVEHSIRRRHHLTSGAMT
ncbi:GTP-binding protein [Streptomyces rhizosphaericus]|uniref:GTP-binding protein n=1 Tax=Streptomyces rhizosphaericus TaxID=114699 RepID=UPI000A3C1C9E|nr:ATP/GTP-binding protein [Streptomyces rhizosphaericus]